MKWIVITLLLGLTLSSQAKIWRVNNTGVGASDFTTFQAAHDGATAGDTLLLVSSVTHYGSLTSSKRLVIFGSGFFLKENYPDYPVSESSKTRQIILESGSQGSVIIGLSGISFNADNILIRASNIKILRTLFFAIAIDADNLSNIEIYQNYFVYIFQYPGKSVTCSNVVVSNNHFSSLGVTWYKECPSIFENNIIVAGNTGPQIFQEQTLINNIATTSITLDNCGLSNNIDASGASSFIFGTANGNQGGYTSSQVFVGPTGTSTDGQWKLKTGSPAIGAGLDGVDCGIFSGDTPYVLSGLPPIPIIKKFLTTGAGSNTTPVSVTVSVESKN